jgi:hypothetical protein
MACKDGGQSTTTRHVAAERIQPKLGFNRRYQARRFVKPQGSFVWLATRVCLIEIIGPPSLAALKMY